MSNRLRLVVGLGNPGGKYQGTRHNIGFMALELLAEKNGLQFRQQSKLHGLTADVGIGDQRLRLLMPQTFMNDSGRSIRVALDWFDLTDQLPFSWTTWITLGRLRLRTKGSAGGHNGLRSTIQHLSTEMFPRLRIGIGAPAENPTERKARTVSHVLGSFGKDEQETVEQVLNAVLDGLQLIQRVGIERAGNSINAFRPEHHSAQR